MKAQPASRKEVAEALAPLLGMRPWAQLSKKDRQKLLDAAAGLAGLFDISRKAARVCSPNPALTSGRAALRDSPRPARRPGVTP